jgi:hypothetical protein
MMIAAKTPEPLPNWIPDAVRHYLAHTEGGVTIRSLAREADCHASTVLRQIRSVENARDDALVDEALVALAKRAARQLADKSPKAPDQPGFTPEDDQDIPDVERIAPGILRRLAQPGAMLAVAADMDRAVIVRDTGKGEAQRIGIVDRPVACALALTRWIHCATPGRIARYRITQAGRDALKRLVAQAENRAFGLTGAPDLVNSTTTRPAGPRMRRRAGVVDTPVLALARRRDAQGLAFLAPELVRVAERIQDDFELAHMEPQIAVNWDQIVAQQVLAPEVLGQNGDLSQINGVPLARYRVASALAHLGPGLGDVVLECCCRVQGLETAEKNLGWSARSGKIVLRIALQHLKRHYDSLGDGGGLIG